MPDKYSFAKCAQYGRRLAARLCQQRFEAQPDLLLDGPALLQLTPVRQVNLLVLHQLLSSWQHEAEQLRSPYFDFGAEPVRAALGQFMNVLSRHLAVGRPALEPLLAQAIASTLLLATDPTAAFEHLLLPPATAATAASDEVPLGYLRERLRYLDQSKAFFEGFVGSLPGGNAPLSREFLQQRLDLYRASHAQHLPALAPLVAELRTLLPLTEADLWDDGPGVAAKPASAPATPAPEAPPTHPTPDAPTRPAAPAAPAATAETAQSPPLPPAASAASEPAPVPSPVAPAPATQPAAPASQQNEAAEAAPPVERPLYEKLKATQPAGAPLAATLREAAPGTAPSLAVRGAPRVGSLRSAISINQRYSFINELFNGENMEYHAAIEHLDQLTTAAAAATYLEQELAPRYDWSRKEEHVAKLLKLLERRFAAA